MKNVKISIVARIYIYIKILPLDLVRGYRENVERRVFCMQGEVIPEKRRKLNYQINLLQNFANSWN